MLKIAFCLAVALVAVQAQERRCAAPPIFQGRVYAYDHETGYFQDGRFSYDAGNEKVRIVERVDPNATHIQVDELVLYHTKKRYVVDLKTRKCTASTFNFPFHRIEVPEYSRFIFENVIGSMKQIGAGVATSTWEYRVDDNETGIMGNMTVTYTRDECLPLTETFYGYASKTKEVLHFHRNYFDITIGLDSPDVFDIPSECMQ